MTVRDPTYSGWLRNDLAKIVEAFCAATGMTRSQASMRLFSSNVVVDNMLGNRHVSSSRVLSFDIAVATFDRYWPHDTPWPEGVRRFSASYVENFKDAANQEYFKRRDDEVRVKLAAAANEAAQQPVAG